MQPPCVLLVSGESPPMQGGVGDYTTLLSAALEGLGVSCDVVTTADRGVPATRNVFPVVPRWSLRDWPILARLIRERRPDILHIQYQTAAYGMRPLINLLPLLVRASRSHISVVTTYHDLRVPYLFPKAGPVRTWANWLLAATSHARITTNDEDFAELNSLLGDRSSSSAQETAAVSETAAVFTADDDARGPRPGMPTSLRVQVHRSRKARTRTTLIPIGSNIPVNPPPGYIRTEWRSRLGVTEGETLLSYFGLLNHSKGVDTLFSAVSELPPEYPVKLVMIGGTAGASDRTNVLYRQETLGLCRTLGLDERVIWTGYANPSEVSGYLLASDTCVLPFRNGASFRRGSLLAALTHAVPVVSTIHPTGRPLGAGPAQLRNEENCLLVSPDDPAATRTAIMRLQACPDLRDHLSSGASGLAESFSWEKIALATADLYESLLGGLG